MKESQLKKVTKEIYAKYGKDTDSVISECAQKIQSSEVDEEALNKLWDNKSTSMKQKEKDGWAEVLRNTENAKQAGLIGCLLDKDASITHRKLKKEG